MTRTLVLNASYQPLTVVSLHRAVVLVMDDKAEVLEADGELRSATTSVPAPTVIRLRRFVRVPVRRRIALTKRNVLIRDRGRCAYCAGLATTIDHVIPRSRTREPHRWDNVVASCVRCNGVKKDRLLDELGWTLSFTPGEPSGWAWLVVGLVDTEPSWEHYLPPLAARVA